VREGAYLQAPTLGLVSSSHLGLASSSYCRSRFKLSLGSRFKFLPRSRFKHSRALSWLLFQLLSNSGDGVSAKSKSGEVGRRGEVRGREVGRREKLWGREEAQKTKNFGQGRMCLCSSSKWLQWPHPQLVHWWLLVHSSPQIVGADLLLRA